MWCIMMICVVLCEDDITYVTYGAMTRYAMLCYARICYDMVCNTLM